MSKGSIHSPALQASSSPTHNPNFRIGVLSGNHANNISRELSAGKRKHEVNTSHAVNVSQDERSNKMGANAIFNRRQSRVLLSRNGSPKASVDHIQQQNKRTVAEYGNILGPITNAKPEPVQAAPIIIKERYNPLNVSHGEQQILSTTQRMENLNRTLPQSSPKRPIQVLPINSEYQRDELVVATPPPAMEEVVVRWADALDGQDIRTELKFGDCLGQGSFAKVYEGFDKRLKIPVAIKVIDKRKIKDSETKKKALIEEEIYIFSRMKHVNIVKFIRLLEDIKRVCCLPQNRSSSSWNYVDNTL